MSALERHYTVQEIAKLWQLSQDTVRKIFTEVPGVLKVGHGERLRRRGYFTIRVPESVLQQVHSKLRGKAA